MKTAVVVAIVAVVFALADTRVCPGLAKHSCRALDVTEECTICFPLAPLVCVLWFWLGALGRGSGTWKEYKGIATSSVPSNCDFKYIWNYATTAIAIGKMEGILFRSNG